MRRLVFVLPVLVSISACVDPSTKLPNFGTVPHFAMTDSLGRPFDSRAMAGKVWIVDFIYTSCPGPCSMMTARMHRLQEMLRGESDVRLVSISVDPNTDTPPVLNSFARKFHGPADDWYFLTGTPSTVHLLAHDVFKVGDIIQNMDHSTRFILVDKHGSLRGYYSSDNDPENGTAALIRGVGLLRRQRA